MRARLTLLTLTALALGACTEAAGGADAGQGAADRAVADGPLGLDRGGRATSDAQLDLAPSPDRGGDAGHAVGDLSAGPDAGCGLGSWTFSAGGASTDYPQHIAVGGAGAATIIGQFSGSTMFGATTLTSAGESDVFVARVSAAGKLLWAVSAGGTAADVGTGIAVDAAGNSYITGSFSGTAKFGGLTLKTLGGNDIFVAKLDPAGKFVWALFTQGTTADMSPAIAVTKAGQAVITGHVTGMVAANGASFIWTDYTQGSPTDIAVDAAGNAFIAGSFTGTATFGQSTFTATSAGDLFVARLDPKGKITMAARAVGTAGAAVHVTGAAVDPTGGIVALAGWFRGSHGFGKDTIKSQGTGQAGDAFFAAMDGKGSWRWAASAGGAADVSATGVALAPAGLVIGAGRFSGNAQFGATSLGAKGSAGKSDAFWVRLGSGGKFLAAARAGGANMDIATGVALDAKGYSYLVGAFNGTAQFGSATLTAKGNADIFLSRLDRCGKY